MTTTGTSGASTYNNTTGVINVPNYTLAGLGGISLTSLSGGTGITYNSSTGAISYSGTVYTDASVRALISASGAVSYNNTTGVISLTSGNLTEATSSVLTITGGTGAVLGSGTSIQVKQATTSVSGFLSSTDWTTFNNKANALSGTTNYVAKFTSSTGIGDSVIYDNGTNVGIGTTTLSASTNYRALNINGTTRSEIYLKGSNVDYGYIYANSSSVVLATQTAIPLNLQTNATTRLTISSTGLVGIGTTTPNTLLTTNQTGTTGYFYSGQKSGTEIVYWYYSASEVQFSSKEAARALVFLTSDVERLRITSAGNVGIGTSSPGGKLNVSGSSGSYTSLLLGTDCVINVSGANSDAALIFASGTTQKSFIYANSAGIIEITPSSNLILTPVGNVLIGTSTNNGEKLYVSGSIRATGTITANSDISLKKNLLKIENALEKVEQINGYTYEFKADDSKRHAGVIAQEIQMVLPEIVNKGNDGILGVEYGNISALLIEATKEQQKQIKAQQTQINELKALLNK